MSKLYEYHATCDTCGVKSELFLDSGCDTYKTRCECTQPRCISEAKGYMEDMHTLSTGYGVNIYKRVGS